MQSANKNIWVPAIGIIFLLSIIPNFLLSQDTTTWKGLTTEYKDPANWSNGVPNGNINVIIPTTSNDPVGDTVQLEINAGFFLEVRKGASLTLIEHNMVQFALDIEGSIKNAGTIKIESAILYAIRFDGLSFLNDSCGMISIDSSTTGIYQFGGNFINRGKIEISNMGQDGYVLVDTFMNMGSIEINDVGLSAFYFPPAGFCFFENKAMIRIENCGNFAFEINTCDTIINRPCGQIIAAGDDHIPAGIKFTNQGTIVDYGSGPSTVGINSGMIYNINGTFVVSSGNAPMNVPNLPTAYNWSGDINRDWCCSGNWSEGLIPDGEQNLFIPDTLNDPIANKKEIVIDSGHIMYLDVGATLLIDGHHAVDDGLTLNGSCYNNGVLDIRRMNDDGIIVKRDTFFNSELGIVKIDSTEYGIYSDSGGVIINHGLQFISNTYEGLWLYTPVYNWGWISLSHIEENAIFSQRMIENRGRISINDAKYGLYLDGDRFDNYGELYIDSTDKFSIWARTIDTLYNHTCGLIESRSTVPIRTEISTFINEGGIIENSPDSSNITENFGYVENLNGGVFHRDVELGFVTNWAVQDPHLTVWQTEDVVPGSLRSIIKCAEDGDTIRYDSSLFLLLCQVDLGEIYIDKSLTILGIPNSYATAFGLNDSTSRLFHIDTSAKVTFWWMAFLEGGGSMFNDKGAAIYNNGELNVYECDFYGNETSGDGAAVYNEQDGRFHARNISFASNRAGDAPVLYNNGGFARIEQSELIRNTGTGFPSASTIITDDSGITELYNSTVAMNKSSTEVGYHYSGTTFRYSNNIVCFNESPNQSIHANNTATVDSSNNFLLADPMFIDTSSNIFYLMPCSPAIDFGVNDSVPLGLTTDIIGNPRIGNGIVDAGIHETIGDPYTSKTLRVTMPGYFIGGDGDGQSWPNAIPSLSLALDIAKKCPVDSILVANGTYFFEDTSRIQSYVLCDSLVLLGGYLTDGSARVLDSLGTFLLGLNFSSDTMYRILTIPDSVTYCEVDGFVLKSAMANHPSYSTGSAIFCEGKAVFSNLLISNNYTKIGGAVYLGPNSITSFTGCTLRDNKSEDGTLFSHENGADVYVGKDTRIE